MKEEIRLAFEEFRRGLKVIDESLAGDEPDVEGARSALAECDASIAMIEEEVLKLLPPENQ